LSARMKKTNTGKAAFGAALLFVSLLVPATVSQEAKAVTSGIELGSASSFAVLAGTGITHDGTTLASGSNGADFGSAPLSSFTGSQSLNTTGTKYVGIAATTVEARAILTDAKADLQTAYNEAAARTVTDVLPTLVIGSQTLIPGVYFSGSSIQITGNLTLDAQDDPNAVFIFKAGSTLVTAISSEIILINGAQACNVYWQVGSSATLSKNSDFSGHVLAHTSITSEDGVSINGQLLAINGAVTLVNNTFVNNSCGTTSTSSPPRSVLASTGQAETTVSWLSPSSTGGSSITGYTANAYTASAYTQETGGTAVASCTATALTCQITGLSNGTPYFIRVSATNAMGDSAESSPAVVVVPEAAPDAPTITSVTAGDHSFSVAFSQVGDDVNAPITGYQYSLDNGSNWIDSSATLSPLLISGLTNGSSYDVKIRAQSDVGVGDPSGVYTVSPISRPNEVDPATIGYEAGNSTVLVSWTAPNSNGAELISTVVTVFSAEFGGTALGSCTAFAPATSCEISGLENGTTYYLSLQVQNSEGNSDLSDPRVLVQPGNASSATLTMSAVSAQAGASVTLTARVTSGATGTVNFTTDNVSILGCGAVEVSSAQALCTVTGLEAKTHAIRANYSGDATYASSATSMQSLAIFSTFTITYDSDGGSVISNATFTTGSSALVLPAPTRTSHALAGWYSSGSLLTKIGDAGDSYVPSESRTIYAKWVNTSPYAVGGNTKFGSFTTVDGAGDFYTASSAAESVVEVSYSADALPASTVVDIYLLTDTTRADSLIPDDKSIVVNLAIDWMAVGGTAPDTAEGLPITFKVTDSAIKKGARIFGLVGQTVTDLGVASEDGSATVVITEVSEIVVVLTNPDAPTGVSATTTTNSATIAFSAPAGNGGASIASYVATASTGQSCSSSSTSCTIIGLSSSTDYTFTVRAINSIGTSIASFASAVVSTSDTATGGTGGGSTGGTGGGSTGGTGGGSTGGTGGSVGTELDDVIEVISREFIPSAPSRPVSESGVIATEDGNVPQPGVKTNEDNEKVVVTGTAWELAIGAYDTQGTPKALASDYALSATHVEQVAVNGWGLAPNTWVDLHVFSDPVFVGTVETDNTGGFNAKFDVPSGLAVGTHTLVLGTKNLAGELITVTLGLEVFAADEVTQKVNSGSFKNYVAVYALGYKGSIISWKIAGEWFRTAIISDYQVFQRRTIDVDVDVKVDIYIDTVKKLSKVVRTR
jgi:hypothetical protein